MGLTKGIQSGQLTSQAFVNVLQGYETQKRELLKRESMLDRPTFVSKMNDIEMSISFAKLFVDNFSKISQSNVEVKNG